MKLLDRLARLGVRSRVMTFRNPKLDRVLGHWQTSVPGVALSAFGVYALQQFGPCMPADWTAWVHGAIIVVGPALLGALSKAR